MSSLCAQMVAAVHNDPRGFYLTQGDVKHPLTASRALVQVSLRSSTYMGGSTASAEGAPRPACRLCARTRVVLGQRAGRCSTLMRVTRFVLKPSRFANRFATAVGCLAVADVGWTYKAPLT